MEGKKTQNHKDDNTEYYTQLRTEFGQLDQSLVHTNRIVQEEIDKILKGSDGSKTLEIHHDTPMKLTAKVLIPVKEFPKVNFVGKLIGPQGATLKRLQHELGVRIAIYGRGSMRDKKKEEDLRKEGGKYAHLNDELHVYFEVNALPEDAYVRLGTAMRAVKPYFDPNYDDGNLPPRDGGDMFNGAPAPRGRGMPPPRGRGGQPPPYGAPPGAPGGPPSLLEPPAVRGGMRGGRGGPPPPGRGGHMGRGAPVGRGAPPPQHAQQYEEDYYGAAEPAAQRAPAAYGYEEPAYEQEPYRAPAPAPRDPYAAPPTSRAGNNVQSFDYGHGTTGAESYEAGQESWDQRDPYARPPAPRGRPTADYRPQPYGERPARPAPRQY